MGMSEQDTREQLEEDVKEWCATYPTWNHANEFREHVFEWLDRQAAITEREVEHDLMLAGRMAVEVERKRIAELTAERDELNMRVNGLIGELGDTEGTALNLQAKVDSLIAERDRLADERYRYKLQCERWGSKIAMLEAECDELQRVVHIQAESFRKLEQELKEARDGVRGSYADDKPGDEKAEG